MVIMRLEEILKDQIQKEVFNPQRDLIKYIKNKLKKVNKIKKVFN
jgi:hypothetical protein